MTETKILFVIVDINPEFYMFYDVTTHRYGKSVINYRELLKILEQGRFKQLTTNEVKPKSRASRRKV